MEPTCRGTRLPKPSYVICHDDDWLVPEWVGYVLTAEDLNGTAARTNDFRADPDLPAGHRAENSDYLGSGYDRGHMAPAADFTRSEEAMSETFLLSNMAPQTPTLNRGEWAGVESEVRQLVAGAGEAVIYTGNLFLNAGGEPSAPEMRIGADGVAVPTHCFKAMLARHADGAGEGFAVVLPNDASGTPWRDGLVSIDEVESLSGFDFFADLPDDAEAAVEAAVWSGP